MNSGGRSADVTPALKMRRSMTFGASLYSRGKILGVAAALGDGSLEQRARLG